MKLILLIVLSLVLAAQSKPYPEEESLDNITDSVADAKMEEEGELGQRIMDDLNAEKAKFDKALEVIEGEIEQTQKDQEEVNDVLSWRWTVNNIREPLQQPNCAPLENHYSNQIV